jgi:hypothetical protein
VRARQRLSFGFDRGLIRGSGVTVAGASVVKPPKMSICFCIANVFSAIFFCAPALSLRDCREHMDGCAFDLCQKAQNEKKCIEVFLLLFRIYFSGFLFSRFFTFRILYFPDFIFPDFSFPDFYFPDYLTYSVDQFSSPTPSQTRSPSHPSSKKFFRSLV